MSVLAEYGKIRQFVVNERFHNAKNNYDVDQVDD
jgi:hypothetical protein